MDQYHLKLILHLVDNDTFLLLYTFGILPSLLALGLPSRRSMMLLPTSYYIKLNIVTDHGTCIRRVRSRSPNILTYPDDENYSKH